MTDSATSVAAAAYQTFQAATAESIPTLTAEFTTLVAAAANPAVQPHVRVYALNIIGQHGSQFDKAVLKTALDAIVVILAEEDESKAPQKLIVTAIDAFVTMCKNTAAKQDDFVRVAADLCVIIILNKEGFPQVARDAAEAGLKELTAASVVGVTKKYLHLLSDEREKDDEEQLEKERSFAIHRLQKIVNDKAHADQWTEEAQTSVQSFIAAVIPTAQRYELRALAAVFTKLSSFGDGIFIVEKLLKAKLDASRLVDALAAVQQYVPRTVTHDAIAEKLLSLVKGEGAAAAPEKPAPKKGGKKAAAKDTPAAAEAASDKIDIVTDATAAVAFLLGARTASAEMADKVADALFEALEKAIPALADETDNTDSTAAPEGLPENLSAVEALLLALAAVAVKNSAYVTEKIAASDNLVARLSQTYKAIEYYKKTAAFAIKKADVDGDDAAAPEAKRAAALTLTVLTNLSTLVGPLTTKHLPTTTVVPSFEKTLPLPRIAGKKSARDSLLSTIIPGASKGSKDNGRDELLNSALPAAKKTRSEGTNGHHGKSHHNNFKRNNSSHNRSGARRF